MNSSGRHRCRVFKLDEQPRITYRRLHDIPESWGTAVNVQAMVLAIWAKPRPPASLHPQPVDRRKAALWRVLVNAQGEDVVAGIRTPQNITEAARIAAGSDKPSLQKLMPDAFHSFVTISDSLEKHYRDMQDLEFTIERGKLWMLQTRSGKRTPRRRSGSPSIWPRQADHEGGSCRPHRSGLARPIAASHHRSQGGARRCRHWSACLSRLPPPARLSFPLATPRTQDTRRKAIWCASKPARRYSRHACGGRHPDDTRRHDQPRRRRCARHGQACVSGAVRCASTTRPAR